MLTFSSIHWIATQRVVGLSLVLKVSGGEIDWKISQTIQIIHSSLSVSGRLSETEPAVEWLKLHYALNKQKFLKLIYTSPAIH